MTINLSMCEGGIAYVPDFTGGKNCYLDSAPYEKLVITQTPLPGELVGAGQTIINVITEDGKGNATRCTHYLNVTANNPAPTLSCPESITAWLPVGGYEVPDFTPDVDVIGGCTVYDKLTIAQSPAAGSLLTTVGVHTITFTVTDALSQVATCGSLTITLKAPSEVP